MLGLCSLSSSMYGCKRTHAQHYIYVKLASKERSSKSHVREATVGKCFNHGSKDRMRAAHVFPSWLRSLLWHLPLRNHFLKDCALKQHIGARTWETEVVLAPWMQTGLTHFHNHEIHRTSCSHPRRFHLSCRDMHVIVNNEYVHHLRAAQSMVFFVKTCCAEDEQCRVSSFHASCVN